MLRNKYMLAVMTLLTVGAIAYFFAGGAAIREQRNSVKPPSPAPALTEPTTTSNTLNYKDTLAKLEAERLRLAARYQQASPPERPAVLDEARAVVTQSVYGDLFPAWYGTPWDFNGTTEVPQQGKIACGYFVSTVLRDAGWKVERVRLAQQASENIILTLTTDSFVKRFRRVAIGDFVNAVKEWGPGIYIVGLDVHVGFIVNTGSEVYFIHSSYVEPYKVVKEQAIESQILAGSNYRVLGRVFADNTMVINWLTGKAIPTR